MTKGFLIYFDLCIKNRMFYVLNGFEIGDFLLDRNHNIKET